MKPVYATHYLRRALEDELLAAAEGPRETEHAVRDAPVSERAPASGALRYRPFERLMTRH
jgi:hypothetical protein